MLLTNKKGEFLLLKRSEKYAGVGGMWDIPGGRITPGTTLIKNLAREIKEETGLTLGKEVTLLGAQDILRVPGRHVVRLTYEARAKGEVALSDEHVAFKWVSLEDLRRTRGLDAYLRALLKKWQTH